MSQRHFRLQIAAFRLGRGGQLCLAFACMVLCQASIDAADWSRFRGPNGSGQAADVGLPSQWTERDYRWQAALDGAGNSSPIVSGSRVIITSANAKTATLKVFSL